MLSASKIFIKRSSTPNSSPGVNQLEPGELALNLADKKIFFKNNNNTISFIDQSPYSFLENLSSVNFKLGNNTVSGVFSSVLEGHKNDVSGSGSTTVNGEDNDIAGDFAFIGSGLKNKIASSGDYSAILGGQHNLISHQNSFTIGSNLSSHADNFTYVNNLSATGSIYIKGVEITNTGSTGADLEVRALTGNWESTYTTVQANSAFWDTAYVSTTALNLSSGNWNLIYTTVQNNSANWDAAYSSAGADLEVRALTGNWESTYTTVQANSGSWNYQGTDLKDLSANWQTAYAYVSANSVNLTATNIFVTNDLTITDTVSAKYFQGTLIDWMTLVRGYKTTPTLLETIAGGEVYSYVYATTGTDKTYYRYIATDGGEDSFYGNFTNPTLSNLIATKAIIL
jgi:hypothetical protein